MAKIMAICISERKGTPKKRVNNAVLLPDWGIDNDAHAGRWHRQVSLLAHERIQEFRKSGAEVNDGDFGENIVVSGIDLAKLPLGTRLRCGDTILELTQIGKECHSHCEIFHRMGDCIMPREGVFCRVIEGGVITPGDEIAVLEDQLCIE